MRFSEVLLDICPRRRYVKRKATTGYPPVAIENPALFYTTFQSLHRIRDRPISMPSYIANCVLMLKMAKVSISLPLRKDLFNIIMIHY